MEESNGWPCFWIYAKPRNKDPSVPLNFLNLFLKFQTLVSVVWHQHQCKAMIFSENVRVAVVLPIRCCSHNWQLLQSQVLQLREAVSSNPTCLMYRTALAKLLFKLGMVENTLSEINYCTSYNSNKHKIPSLPIRVINIVEKGIFKVRQLAILSKRRYANLRFCQKGDSNTPSTEVRQLTKKEFSKHTDVTQLKYATSRKKNLVSYRSTS